MSRKLARQNPILVLGSSGMLGKALIEHLNHLDFQVVKIDHSTAHSWSMSSDPHLIHSFILKNMMADSVIINCAGNINPKSSAKELLQANYRLPRNVLEAANRNNIRFINIGTIMENSGVFQVTNQYVESKKLLLEYIAATRQDKSFLHLQCHTLYSDQTYHSGMFLGQIIESIKKNKVLYTSAGNQIREYHHVDDLALIIAKLIYTSEVGIHQMNSGYSVRQNILSKSIFSHFDKMHLLQINPLDSPAGENYDYFWPRHNIVEEDNFRNPISGIIHMIANQV